MGTSQSDATEAVEVGTVFDIVHLISNGVLTVDFVAECKSKGLKVYISPELKALAQTYIGNVPTSVTTAHVFLATGCCGP